MENIGARRLHTVIERIVEEVSYTAPDRVRQRVVIDAAFVRDRVGDLLAATDMRRYIL